MGGVSKVLDRGCGALPATPDWWRLVDHYGGVLLRCMATFGVIERGAAGRVVLLSAARDADPDLVARAVAELARRGVVAISPDLIFNHLHPLGGGAPVMDVMRWKRNIRRVVDGVVVCPSPEVAKSLIVWNDTCAALTMNQPVWLLGVDPVEPDDAAEGVDF